MRNCILLTLLFFYSGIAKAQLPDSIKTHLDSALLILQEQSLYADKVNWLAVKKEVYDKAKGATTKAATFNAIVYAFQQLQDHHGMFAQYEDQYRNTDSTPIKRYTSNLLNEWKKGWKIKKERFGDVAYLRMPNMPAFNPRQIEQYANLLSDSIAKIAAGHPTAWILDLRMNAGGEIRPMLAALAPFFTDGIVSWYVDKNKVATEPLSFKNGKLFIAGEEEIIIKSSTSPMHKAKIAVLVGVGTGSSGEICATILKQRSHTKLFGEPTAGECNSTQGFPFNGEESYFLLTTQHLANKNKKPLPHQVQPHVLIPNNDLFGSLLQDNTVKAALRWLR